MITVTHPSELATFCGKPLGVSAWQTISEAQILGFSELSGDRHWIHTDPQRAARETPFGGIIAQGFLTLSLLTAMSGECFSVLGAKRWLNYGLDKVRFMSPVKPGDSLRLHVTLAALDALEAGGTRIQLACSMEIEGKPKPALAADYIMIAYA